MCGIRDYREPCWDLEGVCNHRELTMTIKVKDVEIELPDTVDVEVADGKVTVKARPYPQYPVWVMPNLYPNWTPAYPPYPFTYTLTGGDLTETISSSVPQ